MIGAISVPLLLAEPETQGLFIRERERPLWNADNPLERLVVGRDRTLHDLKSDGAGLARHEKISGLLLKSEHERDEDVRRPVWRIGVQSHPVQPLPHDRREERDQHALTQAPDLLTDDCIAVR